MQQLTLYICCLAIASQGIGATPISVNSSGASGTELVRQARHIGGIGGGLGGGGIVGGGIVGGGIVGGGIVGASPIQTIPVVSTVPVITTVPVISAFPAVPVQTLPSYGYGGYSGFPALGGVGGFGGVAKFHVKGFGFGGGFLG